MIWGNDLVRKKPGQRGCCGCVFGLMAGLFALTSAAMLTRSQVARLRRTTENN